MWHTCCMILFHWLSCVYALCKYSCCRPNPVWYFSTVLCLPVFFCVCASVPLPHRTGLCVWGLDLAGWGAPAPRCHGTAQAPFVGAQLQGTHRGCVCPPRDGLCSHLERAGGFHTFLLHVQSAEHCHYLGVSSCSQARCIPVFPEELGLCSSGV